MSDDLVERLRDLGIRVENGMVLERDGMVLEGAMLAIDLDDDAYVLPSGSEWNLVALPARDDNGDILHPFIWRGMVSRFNACPALTALATEQQAQIERLREALKPFADEAEYWETWGADDSLVEWFPEYDGNENPITVGDLRNARAALKGDRNE